MSDDSDLLFYEGDLRATIEGHFAKADAKVDSIPEAQFLAASDDAITDHVVSEIQVHPLELMEQDARMQQEETKLDVSHFYADRFGHCDEPIVTPAQRVTVSIPFSGDPMLWKLRPSSYQLSFPRGEVRKTHELAGFLDIVIELPSECAPEQYKQDLHRTLQDLRSFLGNQRTDIERLNASLPARVRQAVVSRRSRLEKHSNVAQVLAIPLARKPGVPDAQSIPIQRRTIKPLPPAPNRPVEPGIREEDYEHILSVIRHEGRSFEATPSTFAVHDEEELRDIILAHLNGHYKGDATGEAFRRSGKTDIRIESGNRAAFVAECKVWRGPKELLGAVDQLLGYLTWRDCKTALVLFNKDVASFSALQSKLPGELKAHCGFIADLASAEAGEWRVRIRASDDPDRIITVHVFLFNLHVPQRATTD